MVGKLDGRMVVIVWTPRGDAPELTEEFFEQADEYRGEKLVRRGRPKSAAHKVLLSVRYSPEVVDPP
jgi:hypothetical protein